ncbi:MAG: glucan biosynthesis protein, partial [Hyphomonas sp.]
MKRRQFLNAATAMAAGGSIFAANAEAQISSGDAAETIGPVRPEPFGFEDVAAIAADRASRIYQQPISQLVGSFADLDYDHYRAIRFRRDRDPLGPDGDFGVDLLSPGMIFYEPVQINIVRNGIAHHLPFDPSMLEFDPSHFPDGADLETVGNMGWSGFRVRTVLNRPNVMDEFLVFQGASYFRAVARDTLYGLSARGLAIKTGSSDGEEFPLFTDFWIHQPQPGDDTVRIHAVLDSRSVSGAYQFDIHPGSVTMVQTRLA